MTRYSAKKLIYAHLLLLALSTCNSATLPAQKPACMNPAFDQKVINTIRFSVPVISVDELNDKKQKLRIFDARERAEYDVSHIPGAVFVGYQQFNQKIFDALPKDTPIVLYCSIGYRSEKIGEKLLKQGFTKVYNLYGSIFEWVNKGYPVVNPQGTTIAKVHTYNKDWSRWVDAKKIEKIW
jgi:rhodanese-related sulfurtransferase